MPPLRITTLDIAPMLFKTTCNSKSSPVPAIVIFGGFLYPRPAATILIFVIVPSTITGSSCATVALTVPTKRNSSSVSIAASYSPDNTEGTGSLSDKFRRLKLSIASCSDKTLLTLSTTSFNASVRLTNHPCLGLFKLPYFCFTLNVGSGTAL